MSYQLPWKYEVAKHSSGSFYTFLQSGKRTKSISVSVGKYFVHQRRQWTVKSNARPSVEAPVSKSFSKTKHFQLNIITVDSIAEQTNCTINKTLTLTYTIEADKISRSEKKKSLQNPHIFQGTIWRLFVNHVLCFLCKHGQVVFQNGHIHWKPFSNAWIILFGVSNHDSIFLNGRVENNMVPWI